MTIRLPYIFSVCMMALCIIHIMQAQSPSIDWESHREAEKGKSPYINRIIEYKPAPGQFINETGSGTPEAAESIVGDVRGLVSLGGFGGYIVVGFDHTIWNDPDNPYGVDFTVVGNAAPNSSEPGIVMVMADTNGNGLPDDTWYELKGSNYDLATTIHHYAITYTNPKSGETVDIPWADNQENTGTIKALPGHHGQSYYPATACFPDYPQEEVSFTGTLIGLDINDNDPGYIRIDPLPFGYADNLPFKHGTPPYLPDNPQTPDVLEGNGGNAFDIDWAVDSEGKPVYLEGIDFIKIYTGVNINAGWLGEISTEVCGIIDVSPDDVTSSPAMDNKSGMTIYPNPTSSEIKIQSNDQTPITCVEIWNTTGQLFYINSAINGNEFSIVVAGYPAGIYLVKVRTEKQQTTTKILIKAL